MDVFNAEKTSGVNGTRNMADDRYFVFMLSTRAGGLGINLVRLRSGSSDNSFGQLYSLSLTHSRTSTDERGYMHYL